jgi:hypothetical protein
MAGVAGLEPVTSAVTGQRSNQLSYTPAQGRRTLRKEGVSVKAKKEIRAADAKEVGVGNPAEETYCYPNTLIILSRAGLSIGVAGLCSGGGGIIFPDLGEAGPPSSGVAKPRAGI